MGLYGRILATLAGLAFSIAACDRAGREGLLGTAPAHRPIHLVDLPATVTANAEARAADSRILVGFDRDDLVSWAPDLERGLVRFASPLLGAGGLEGAGTLRLRLQPGGATRVAVVPHARGAQQSHEHRALRTLELALERDANPDEPVDLAVDLHEALHGNFGDAGRGGRLDELEILLPGADPARVVLHSLIVERRRWLPPGEVAASTIADLHGLLRPAWVLRGGAEVEIDVELPLGAPELRWHDAAAGDTGERRVEILHGGETLVLSRDEPVAGVLGAPWTPRRQSLARFAGETVRIRMRVEPPGVGFFGDPTILRVRDGPDPTPDVLVYLIDTLRADHLGASGPGRPDVSPTLDRLAREGAWFRRAQSSSPWTKPAIATLMSGIFPTTHRVGATRYTDRMPTTVPLVQQRFRSAGWRTGSFAANPLGSTLSALERGFGTVYAPRAWQARARLDMNPSAEQLHAELLSWIDEQPDRPFFGYVHTLEVHEWKLPRYQSGLPQGFSPYDAAIFDADRHLGRLLEELEARGRDVVVVVTSDHGESWGDHGLPSHGFGLYQSQIHIPLIFWKRVGLEPHEVHTPVSLADLAPTLLDGFGIPPLDDPDGVSLVPALAGAELSRGPVLSALLRFVWAPAAPKQWAVTTSEQVVWIRPEEGREQAFDLVIDPRELQPLSAPDAEIARTLDTLLARQTERADAFTRRHGSVVPGPVTAEDSARLRALGYLGRPEAPANDGPPVVPR